MAKRSDVIHSFGIAVVGLSGTEAVKGFTGVGKSCLCNRFVRPDEDDFFRDHLSFLSAADFNGQVVNNDHFLYWGKATKLTEDGTEYNFHVIEQTEFLDDTTFSPLRSGKMDPYLKRCSQTKLQSAEKLMYICKNQLGVEESFEKFHLPNGKICVDGFVCVVDVSRRQPRHMESQLDFISQILSTLQKTKKPVVLAATKMDDCSDTSVLIEIQKIVSRKEFKGTITVVETSAVLNVNTDLPFMVLASSIEKSKAKITSYAEALKAHDDQMESARLVYIQLLNSVVLDYRLSWSSCSERMSMNREYNSYVKLYGKANAQKLFKSRVQCLRDEFIAKRKAEYLLRAPLVIAELFPDLHSIANRSWQMCLGSIASQTDFSEKFIKLSTDWFADERFLASADSRIPLDFMLSLDIENLFRIHVSHLQAERRRLEMRKQLREALVTSSFVIPGMHLKEIDMLFSGRDYYDLLPVQDRHDVYQQIQVEIREKARRDFLELLYERSDVFSAYEDPDTPITQEDVEQLMDLLRSEPKCKALSRCEEDRKVIMLNHLGFLQYPIKEQCPFRMNCMELSIQKCLSTKNKRSTGTSAIPSAWQLNPKERQLNLIILGSEGLPTDLVNEIRHHYPEDELLLEEYRSFSLDYRTIDGDVSLPQNAFRSAEFSAHGCICVYSSASSLDFIKDGINKTFLSPNDERLLYAGLPVVIVQAYNCFLSDKANIQLGEDGRELAASLKCQFMDALDLIHGESQRKFVKSQIPRAVREIAMINVSRDTTDFRDYNYMADIRMLMCLMCADSYSVESVLQPFLAMQTCQVVTNDRYHVIQFDTYIADNKRKVEVIIASYHDASLLKDELCNAYILVYSTRRRASYSVMESFLPKIAQCVPVLVMAVSDGDEPKLGLTDLGKMFALKHQAQFITTSQLQHYSPVTHLLKDAWNHSCAINQLTCAEELNSDLELSHGSLPLSNAASPGDSNRQFAVHAGTMQNKRQWGDSRSALYLAGWTDNNDIPMAKDRLHTPLSDLIELRDYEEPIDALSESSDEYALVQDALPAGKVQRVYSTVKRDAMPAFSMTDSESDMSSLERTHNGSPDVQRRAQSPLVYRREVNTVERKANSLPRSVVHRGNLDPNWENGSLKISNIEHSVVRKRSLRLSRRRKPVEGNADDESGTSFLDRFRVVSADPDKQKRKEEKRRQKEEDKVLRDKQKAVRRKIKSQVKRRSYLMSRESNKALQDYVQAEAQLIPKFVEICVHFIESEGLLAEGIYRVPGNTAHVELFKEMFNHNRNIDISTLNIGPNAVATALKGFFSELCEPLVPRHLYEELVTAFSIPEKSSRLLALRGVLKKLPPANHEVLRYLMTHLYKLTRHGDRNHMDSRNLAICWWPSIIRPEILSVEDISVLGKAMQDIVVTLIEQHGFFFYNEHEV